MKYLFEELKELDVDEGVVNPDPNYTGVTDCDYCGEIALVSVDGGGGKICRKCNERGGYVDEGATKGHKAELKYQDRDYKSITKTFKDKDGAKAFVAKDDKDKYGNIRSYKIRWLKPEEMHADTAKEVSQGAPLSESTNEGIIGKYEIKYTCKTCGARQITWPDEDPTYCGECGSVDIYITSKHEVESVGEGVNENFGNVGQIKIVRYIGQVSRSGYGIDSIGFAFHDGETGNELNIGWHSVYDQDSLIVGGLYKMQWYNTTNNASWGQSSGWKIIGIA